MVLPYWPTTGAHAETCAPYSLHSHGVPPHFGHPPLYLPTASSSSIPQMLAVVLSQAKQSANSSRSRAGSLVRMARASSPTSSMNQRNVPSSPRALSFSK